MCVRIELDMIDLAHHPATLHTNEGEPDEQTLGKKEGGNEREGEGSLRVELENIANSSREGPSGHEAEPLRQEREKEGRYGGKVGDEAFGSSGGFHGSSANDVCDSICQRLEDCSGAFCDEDIVDEFFGDDVALELIDDCVRELDRRRDELETGIGEDLKALALAKSLDIGAQAPTTTTTTTTSAADSGAGSLTTASELTSSIPTEAVNPKSVGTNRSEVLKEVVELNLEIKKSAQQLREVREKASEVTEELRRLETEKKNISSATSCLQQLEMFDSSLTSIRKILISGSFEQSVGVVSAADAFAKFFGLNFSDVPKVRHLLKQHESLQFDFRRQLLEEIELCLTDTLAFSQSADSQASDWNRQHSDWNRESGTSFSGEGSREVRFEAQGSENAKTLRHCLEAADVCEPELRSQIVQRVILQQLEIYEKIFQSMSGSSDLVLSSSYPSNAANAAKGNQAYKSRHLMNDRAGPNGGRDRHLEEATAFFDSLGRRVAWLEKTAASLAKLFPSHWNVNTHLTSHFVTVTRQHMLMILERARTSFSAPCIQIYLVSVKNAAASLQQLVRTSTAASLSAFTAPAAPTAHAPPSKDEDEAGEQEVRGIEDMERAVKLQIQTLMKTLDPYLSFWYVDKNRAVKGLTVVNKAATVTPLTPTLVSYFRAPDVKEVKEVEEMKEVKDQKGDFQSAQATAKAELPSLSFDGRLPPVAFSCCLELTRMLHSFYLEGAKVESAKLRADSLLLRSKAMTAYFEDLSKQYDVSVLLHPGEASTAQLLERSRGVAFYNSALLIHKLMSRQSRGSGTLAHRGGLESGGFPIGKKPHTTASVPASSPATGGGAFTGDRLYTSLNPEAWILAKWRKSHARLATTGLTPDQIAFRVFHTLQFVYLANSQIATLSEAAVLQNLQTALWQERSHVLQNLLTYFFRVVIYDSYLSQFHTKRNSGKQSQFSSSLVQPGSEDTQNKKVDRPKADAAGYGAERGTFVMDTHSHTYSNTHSHTQDDSVSDKLKAPTWNGGVKSATDGAYVVRPIQRCKVEWLAFLANAGLPPLTLRVVAAICLQIFSASIFLFILAPGPDHLRGSTAGEDCTGTNSSIESEPVVNGFVLDQVIADLQDLKAEFSLAGVYKTDPMKRLLTKLIDSLCFLGKMRLTTVGEGNGLCASEMVKDIGSREGSDSVPTVAPPSTATVPSELNPLKRPIVNATHSYPRTHPEKVPHLQSDATDYPKQEFVWRTQILASDFWRISVMESSAAQLVKELLLMSSILF